MHMAIAAFVAGTPPSSITYQDKFQGLYDLFDLDGPLMTLEESLERGALRRFIDQGIDNGPCLSHKIQDRLPELLELAERNLGV